MINEYWTEEQEKDVAYRWLVLGQSCRKIADETSRTKSSVHRCVNRLGLKGKQGEVAEFAVMFDGNVQPPVRPVHVNAYKAKGATVDNVSHVSLHTTDIHFPFQDEAALEILYRITEDVKPSILVDHGDLVDCWQLSTHRPPNERTLTYDQVDLQQNINASVAHLALMHDLAKPQRSVYLGGNHEDRHERVMSEMNRDPRVRHLMSLDAITEQLKWHNIMGLERLGIEYRSYHDHGDPFVLFNRLVLSHGHYVNQWPTRTMLETYGKSSMFGHTHKVQNWTGRNLKGQEASWNIGCLCDVNPHYMPFANWHQGFAVVYWHQTGDGWLYDVNQVRIHNGRSIFQGKSYKS